MDTWVLLRGLTRESRHWGSFAGQFQQAIAQARVLTPDLPGNGLLNGQRSPSQVAAMVEFCRAQLQQQQLAPPFKVLAMSLGAMVSVAWSQTYPRELAAFPMAALKQSKYWPPVGRIDNVYGDRNLFCSCVPVGQ